MNYPTYLVEILPNTENKAKWYYGWISKDQDITGEILEAMDHGKSRFDGSYYYKGSCYISKEDCKIIRRIK